MFLNRECIGFSAYTILDDKNFPAEECTISKGEDIYESPNWYECVLININHPEDGFMIRCLTPYKCTPMVFGRELSLYGWCAENDGEYYDNAYYPIHNDNIVVIAYKMVNKLAFDELTKLCCEFAKDGRNLE